MAKRRSSVVAAVAQAQRQADRNAAARARAHQQALRSAEKAHRERERAAARDEKERARLHSESRQADVDALNADLDAQIAELGSLLLEALRDAKAVDFEEMKVQPEVKPLTPGWLANPLPAPVLELPPAPTGLHKAFGAKKYAGLVSQVEAQHQSALAEHAAREADRIRQLDDYTRQHQAYVAGVNQQRDEQHAEIDAFRNNVIAGQPDAICDFFTLVLERSSYPEDFPQRVQLGWMPESRQLVIEHDLPAIDCVPDVAAYRYVKTGDKVNTTARSAAQRRTLYASVVSQVALRTLHELFTADPFGQLETAVYNGFVDTINPGTGQPQRTCLVTVRVSNEMLQAIDLARVEPAACLKALNASVSKSPAELSPVRPVLELSMVDPRFIQETDVLSQLDQRPNLMDLTPSEFESLITNLFEKMGLETRLTQASRDGGVDCVAYDPRPIFGGKVVIQAKRYKHTVGVSAVRDLFGTMQNEGASKGILVTTSGYGKASFAFADGKPLELLSGSNLLYLLAEHAGIEAKIEPPEDWHDPVPDSGEAEVAIEGPKQDDSGSGSP